MYHNNVTLIGFLGSDATIHTGKNGSLTTLARNQVSYKTRNRQVHHAHGMAPLIVFGRRGEFAAKLKKGDHILVEG